MQKVLGMSAPAVEEEQVLRFLEDKHWRFYHHITTIEAEMELELKRPSFVERLMEQSEYEAITDFFVSEAKWLQRLREHDSVCQGCQKPTEKTEDGLRAVLDAMAWCM